MGRKTSDKITVMKGERKMFQSDVVEDLKKFINRQPNAQNEKII